MPRLAYTRGGLIQERKALRSAYDVWIPELKLCVGRVESYWDDSHGWSVRWRSLDHWYCDYAKGFASRNAAAQDLVTKCPRAGELIQRRRERLSLATGGARP